MIFTRVFWRDCAERSISTGAQAAILAIGQDVVGFDVFTADLPTVAGAAVGGAVLCVLKCLAAAKVPGTISPASLTEV
jgi:hypothetical protein